MLIPELFDETDFHTNGTVDVILQDAAFNHDSGVHFIEGTIEPNTVGIKPQFIRSPVYGNASKKVWEILGRSWIKTNAPGHIPPPTRVKLKLNSDHQIIDLACPICEQDCQCHANEE